MNVLVIGVDVMAALAAHARTAAGLEEVGGALIVEEVGHGVDEIVGYEPAVNVDPRPGWYAPDRWPDLRPPLSPLSVHTHPAPMLPAPSVGDVIAALEDDDDTFAIYQPEQRHLRVWRLAVSSVPDGDRFEPAPAHTYRQVPLVERRRLR